MPIITKLDRDKGRVLSAVVGHLNVQDIEDHLKLERHFRGIAFPELLDARAARIDFTSAQVREIVALVRRMSQAEPFGPTAVLISTDVEFGIVRMAQALLDDVCEVKPFRNEAEAQAWLGWDAAVQSSSA